MSSLNAFSPRQPVTQVGPAPQPAAAPSAPLTVIEEAPQAAPAPALSPDQFQAATPPAGSTIAPVSFDLVSNLQEHTVRKGETLSSISQRYLGTPNRYMEIFDLNRKQLPNPDRLRIGMRLQVPLPEPAAPTPAQPSQPAAPELATHRVRRGESLSDIARKYLGNPNRYTEIYQLNRDQLRNPHDLNIGMTLKLPLPAAAQPPEEPSTPPPVTAPVTPSPTAPVAPAPGQSYTQHTVKRGESLSELALTYLGDSERYMEIFNANRDQLKTPDSLRLGMKLNIPTSGQPQPSQPAPTQGAAPTAPVGVDGLNARATELYQAMQRYQQYHAQRGNTQRTRTTPAQMREIAVELDKASQAFNVDPKMMLALYAHESGGINPRARSHTGAGGLGQLTSIAIRQVHHMAGMTRGSRGEAPFNQHKANFVQNSRSINQRYDIKANVWTSVAYMHYELTDRASLGRGVEKALKRYGDPHVPTYANKVNAEYNTLFGGRLF